MRPLAKFEIAVAIGSFLLIFLVGLLVRAVAMVIDIPEKTVDVLTKTGIILCFCVFGFACIGLMLHVFVGLQARVGNAGLPMVHFISEHMTAVTLGVWAFLGLGTVIALPFALHDLAGLEIPIAKPKGVLAADIGMTMDDVKARSTFKLKEPRTMGDGSLMDVEDVVFDFQIGDSAVRFPQARYYWIETGKGDPHITVLNVGISPKKLPKAEFDTFQHSVQERLLNDGWMPGHFLAQSEETVRLWGGKHTTGDGRYWAKGGTLIILEVRRMDEERRDEPPGSGEFILNLYLRPRSHEKDLVFEPSAWKP